MAYTPHTWTTGETIDAAKLNANEQGTQAAAAAADTANSGLNSKVNSSTYTAGLAGKADLPAGGTDGQALVKAGTTTAWATVSGGTTPDATSTAKGAVQLAGDLAGTAAAPTVPGLAGKLTAASNLSDVANAATARTNLGLGSAATSAATAFDASGAATAAQAAAVQRANHTGTQAASTITGLSTVATSGAYTDLSAKPTIPTVGAAGAGAAVALSSTDASVTNSRTPSAHAASHAAGGSDAIAVTSAQVSDATTVGKALVTAADAPTARTAIGAGTASFPTQTGNAGKFLTTDGTSPAWGTPAGGGVPSAWAASTAYTAGQQVTYRGRTYAAKTGHTSGTSFNPTNWTLLSGAVVKRGVTIPVGALANWQAARDASGTTAAEVVVFGDSTTFGASDATSGGYAYYSWVQSLRLRATTAGTGPMLDGGRGVTAGADSVDLNLALPDSFSNVVSRTGFTAGGNNGVRLTDQYASTTAGDTVTYQGKGTKIRLDYAGGASYGRFTVSVDGGAATTIDPPSGTSAGGTLTTETVTFSGLAEGTHTIAVTNSGGKMLAPPAINGTSTPNDAASTLTKGATYYYKVVGVTASGSTTASASVNATVNAGVAQDVQLNIASAVADTWVSFDIYRATAADTSPTGYKFLTNVTKNSGGFNTVYNDTGAVTPTAQTPPTVNTAGLDNTKKTVEHAVEFLRDTGLVFHKCGTSGITFQAYFDYQNPTLLNYNAAVALGLDPQATSINGYGWGLSKKAGTDRNVKAAICALGINNISMSTAPAAMSNVSDVVASIGIYAETFVHMARAAGADPIIVIPHIDRASGPEWYAAAVRTALTTVAMSRGCALVDFNEVLGPVNTHAAQGFGVGNVSTPHIGKLGYDLEGQFMWDEVLSV